MSLTVHVLHLRRSQVFHPGDQVSGHVVATGPIRDENTSVTISFLCSSMVKLKVDGQTIPYTNEHSYFCFRKVLFRGPCSVQEGSSATWPFKFELPLDPKKVQNPLEPKKLENSDGNKEVEPKPPNPFELEVQKETPLPPSFSISGTQGGMISTAVDYRGSIVYELCSELQRSKTFSRMRRAKGGIPVTLCRPLAQIEQADTSDTKKATRLESFSYSSSRLRAGGEDQSCSLRQWTSDALSRGKTPRIYFRLAARMPTNIVRGIAIPLHLSLKVERGGAEQLTTATPPLQFEFVTACFEFKALTKLNGSYLWSSHENRASDEIFSCDLKIDPSETIWTGDNKPIEIERQVSIPRNAKKIVPSFKAKFMERNYFAKLTLEVKIGGKKFEAKFRWSTVTVLTDEVETPGEGEEIVAGLDKEPDMTIIGAEEVGEWGLEALNGILEIVGDILS